MIDPLFNPHLTFRRRWKHGIFLLLKLLFVPTLRLLVRFRVHGLRNIPKRGGAVVVGNHVHNADPVLMYSATNRPIFFMTKDDVWRVPGVRWIAQQSGAFPVRRGKMDRAAIRTASALLEEGLLVGMYPEGTRSVSGGLSKPFPGASLIATLSHAPVIPVAIMGSEDLPFNGAKQQPRKRLYPQVTVVFGPPFRLEPRKDDGTRYTMNELTDAMMTEIARLLPDDMRGIYADRCGERHPAVRRDRVQFTGPV